MGLWSVTRRLVYYETVCVEAESEAEAIERVEGEEPATAFAYSDDTEVLGVVPLPVVSTD